MDPLFGPPLIRNFTLLEDKITRTSKALSEASLRLATLMERGPLITPNLEEWTCYVQELENDLTFYLMLASNFMMNIGWEDAERPISINQWAAWQESVKAKLLNRWRTANQCS